MRKGSKIYVEGRLETRSWDDQSGQTCYTTEVVVNDLQMLDGRGDAGGDMQQGNYQEPPPAGPSGGEYGGGGDSAEDDDLPF